MENKKKGFTLVELLIVITLTGILAGIVMIAFGGASERAKISKAKAEMKDIYNGISMLELDTVEWPGHKTPHLDECGQSNNEICPDGCNYGLSDCEAGLLCNPLAPDDYINWKGPYVEEVPEDPWGNEYFFDTDYHIGVECMVAIGSYGPNGVGLNQYDEDDIIYIIPSQ